MSDLAIPAATLILVRERGPGPPELLMVERSENMAFAGGALVFPGGRVDNADVAIGQHSPLQDAGARVAAIRETVEETAIPVGLDPRPEPGQARELQSALIREKRFDELLQRLELSLNLDVLVPLARWVPKFHARRRFDTLFFIARAPDGNQLPTVIESECVAAEWITATDALERDRKGEAKLIFPTRRTLERIARHADFASMVADALAHKIEPITPWVEESGGERFIAIPPGIGFPITRERLDGLWRG